MVSNIGLFTTRQNSECFLNELDKMIHDGGQNRPHFFSKLRAENNGPCNTDSLCLLVDY